MTDLAYLEDRWGNPGKALSRMIRPAITAPPGKVLVWGDWSNIEARVLPWLAEDERRLDVFRRIDADPSAPDVYVQGAAGMYGHDADELMAQVRAKKPEAKTLRQRGKVAELALGFAGGGGALQSMAANYGMAFEDDEAKDIVKRWRSANAWAVEFWDDLWDAFLYAHKHHGEMVPCGRVTYQGLEYLGRDSVVCYLPDGRPLVYRDVREKEFIERDEFDPEIIIERKSQLVFDGQEGPKKLWKGILVENITQGTAASVLRWTVRTLRDEEDWMPVVAHTHDEIIGCVDFDREGEAKFVLEQYMLQDYGWNADLPTAADITANVCYTKTLDD